MGRQTPEPRTLSIPFEGQDGQLVMLLPQRFSPWGPRPLLFFIAQKVVPGLLALLLCMLLYRLFIAPLAPARTGQFAEGGRPRRASGRTLRFAAGRARRAGPGLRSHGRSPARHRGLPAPAAQRPLTNCGPAQPPARGQRARGRPAGAAPAPGARDRRDAAIGGKHPGAGLDGFRAPAFPQEAVPLRPLWDVLTEDACFETDGPGSNCVSSWTSGAWSRPTSTAWPRPWRTCCAMPSAIHLRAGWSRCPAARRASTGCCASATRDRGGGRTPGADLRALLPARRGAARRWRFRPGAEHRPQRHRSSGGRLWACNLNPGLGLHMRLQAWPGGASGSG